MTELSDDARAFTFSMAPCRLCYALVTYAVLPAIVYICLARQRDGDYFRAPTRHDMMLRY